jgi:phospholipase C
MPAPHPHLPARTASARATRSRRAFLWWLAAAGGAWLSGCAGASQRTATPTPAASATAAQPRTPTGSPLPAPTLTQPPTATAAATTKASPVPSPSATASAADRIDTVLVFIQENHTFDSLFAGFPGADGQDAGQPCPDMLPSDPPHQHTDALVADGATTDAARCSYTEATAPLYWQLAREFTLCDQFFSDVRGPSHPNYFMATSAQTPIVNAPSPTDLCPQFCYDYPTLATRLDAAGRTWRDYGGILTDIQSMYQRPEVFDRQDAPYFADAAAGTLPNFAWLNSVFLAEGDALSGHPPASLCDAQNYAARVINAAMSSPQWPHMAIYFWWDDWGGFYDHVPPPVVENWTDGTPLRYGFRVPCIVISPYAKAGYVSHTLASQVSFLRFAESLYDLQPLTERDAQASDLLDCFDFNQPARAPLTLEALPCGA